MREEKGRGLVRTWPQNEKKGTPDWGIGVAIGRMRGPLLFQK